MGKQGTEENGAFEGLKSGDETPNYPTSPSPSLLLPLCEFDCSPRTIPKTERDSVYSHEFGRAREAGCIVSTPESRLFVSILL